jgi:hypothetical protein
MSETPWTPGPWRQEEYTTLVWGECSPHMASGMGYPIARGVGSIDPDTALANARLIAAAPTMAEYIIGRARYGDGAAIAIVEALGVKL